MLIGGTDVDVEECEPDSEAEDGGPEGKEPNGGREEDVTCVDEDGPAS